MRISRKFGLFLALAQVWPVLTASGQAPRAAPAPLTWKPVENCVLRIDERPAKIWEVYLVPKKKNLVLIQLGARFLQLDTDAKAIYEVAPEALERKGRDLIQQADEAAPGGRENSTSSAPTGDSTQSAQRHRGHRVLLTSADWTERDAGRARIVRLRLTEEGRRLEVQLPIAPDLRKVY